MSDAGLRASIMRCMHKRGVSVADLFDDTSPFAEASPDAGPKTNGPHSLQHHCCARCFHRTGRRFSARRGPGVVCCMSYASGNRRTAPMPSDSTKATPNARLRQARNMKCDRIETCVVSRVHKSPQSRVCVTPLAAAAANECTLRQRAHRLRSSDTEASADADANRRDVRPFARTR